MTFFNVPQICRSNGVQRVSFPADPSLPGSPLSMVPLSVFSFNKWNLLSFSKVLGLTICCAAQCVSPEILPWPLGSCQATLRGHVLNLSFALNCNDFPVVALGRFFPSMVPARMACTVSRRHDSLLRFSLQGVAVLLRCGKGEKKQIPAIQDHLNSPCKLADCSS